VDAPGTIDAIVGIAAKIAAHGGGDPHAVLDGAYRNRGGLIADNEALREAASPASLVEASAPKPAQIRQMCEILVEKVSRRPKWAADLVLANVIPDLAWRPDGCQTRPRQIGPVFRVSGADFLA